MPLLVYVLYERRGMVTVHFCQEKGKFIYKALTLLGK